jgi:hypothetical protein
LPIVYGFINPVKLNACRGFSPVVEKSLFVEYCRLRKSVTTEIPEFASQFIAGKSRNIDKKI